MSVLVKYDMYKKIFSGARNVDDINFLRELCPEQDKKIIDIVISPITHQKIGYVQMSKIIDSLNKIEYIEECEQYIKNIYKSNITRENKNTKSILTLNSDVISNIISSKKHDDRYIEIFTEDKKCPHCGEINTAPIGTSYIVCGVDTFGKIPICDKKCMNDWCFLCGKKLCKNWYNDNLYVYKNRSHNDICCRIHARDNGFKYPDEYCQCMRL